MDEKLATASDLMPLHVFLFIYRFLEKIEVTVGSTGEVFVFPCNAWLSSVRVSVLVILMDAVNLLFFHHLNNALLFTFYPYSIDTR